MVFTHETLQPSADYLIALDAGYRDRGGQVNSFRHSWRFHTEPPPALRGQSPAPAERGVDPATYLSLSFSRDMNPASFRGAVTFSPAVAYAVRSDPADARRVVIAPRSLLDPNAEYSVTINENAQDVDGNRLPSSRLAFTTGNVKPLARFITFVATLGRDSIGSSGNASGSGVWMVDEAGFPRILEDEPIERFSWSPDGSNLLARQFDGRWFDYPLGAEPLPLSFSASWAAWLGPQAGYAYLEGTGLYRLLPSGESLAIASPVTAVAVSNDLGRLAYAVGTDQGAEIRGYDVELRSQYRLQSESLPVRQLIWAPNGRRLAFVEGSFDAVQLRVRSLTGTAETRTLATGDLADVVWLADSNQLLLSARIDVGGGERRWRIFRINTSVPPAQLTPGLALASAIAADSFSPRPSPDGHEIAFLSGPADSAQVWLMNADGSEVSRLTGYDAETFPYSCRALHWASN